MSKAYLVTRESLLRALCSKGDGCPAHAQTVDKMLAAHEPVEDVQIVKITTALPGDRR